MMSYHDYDEASTQLGGQPQALTEATSRLKKLGDSLFKLQQAGLPRQATAALLRTYAGAASQYALQLHLPTDEQIREYDAALTNSWQRLAQRDFADESKDEDRRQQRACRRRADHYREGCTALVEIAADRGARNKGKRVRGVAPCHEARELASRSSHICQVRFGHGAGAGAKSG